ncbi:protein of unknown function [Kyrpidia spormannii]|uniref:Uncharacterized protein n=1 Tax=Kyrpidia spormannii TaxID=2055160 RepID=A0ACA8Z6X8_9BACL|nr:protein of unknown function [Kyrpidia spormannii]
MPTKGAWIVNRKPRNILIVEDEQKLRDVIASYLEKAGYRPLQAARADEAWDLLQQEPADLVILDLLLPDMPGEELCKKIRAHTAVPILMLTAKAGETDRIRGLSLGADDYVTKPFSPRGTGGPNSSHSPPGVPRRAVGGHRHLSRRRTGDRRRAPESLPQRGACPVDPLRIPPSPDSRPPSGSPVDPGRIDSQTGRIRLRGGCAYDRPTYQEFAAEDRTRSEKPDLYPYGLRGRL